jgi:hypothetical protein
MKERDLPPSDGHESEEASSDDELEEIQEERPQRYNFSGLVRKGRERQIPEYFFKEDKWEFLNTTIQYRRRKGAAFGSYKKALDWFHARLRVLLEKKAKVIAHAIAQGI